MKYSYHWIKELSGTKKSPERLAKLLIAHAFEVEAIEKFASGLEGVVVGKVLKLEKHPNADKLRVAGVEVGKSDVRSIVCGAPNVAVGQLVAVAIPGATLPGGMIIKEAELRGIVSQGMICSAKELGLGDNHEGILVLPKDTPVGASFVKFFGLEDSILDVKILPDRGADALAYEGLAREVAALDGHAPRFVEKTVKPLRVPAYNRAPKIVIEDKKACLRYLGMSFQGITIADSPVWLKAKLLVAGQRPINNVVDATNYLMLLTGQPMHAFDADKITGNMSIRRAKKNEKLKLLNGEVKKLVPDDLVIADSKGALALAGVMGGASSAISEKTKNIFFEIANFDGATVRRTKNRHSLPTDASYRFERNLDPNLPGEAGKIAASLLLALTGGKLMGQKDVYPQPRKSWKIMLSLERVEEMLGLKVPLFEVVQYLALLGLKVKKVAGEKALSVEIPTRRPDLKDEWDLIEEIGRMKGYDKIAPLTPLVPLVPGEANPEKSFERRTKEYLAASGFDEIMTYSFYGEKEMKGAVLPLSHHLELENPLSPDQKYLRMNQVPHMLQKIKANLRTFESFDIFDWGSVFGKDPKTGTSGEVESLGLMTVLSKKSEKGEAFFVMKGKVEALFKALHIDTERLSWELPEKFPELPVLGMLHPTRTAVFAFEGKPFGIIGEIHPQTLKAFDLEPRVAMAGFVAEDLEKLQMKEIVFAPLQRFPYAVRDISLTFPKKVTVAEVESLLRNAGAPLLRRLELFDIYEQKEEKSLAFHLSFGAEDRTLSSAEMDAAFDRIVRAVGERLEGRLRL